MARMRNYINNREMHDVLVKYLSDCNNAEEAGKPLPQIPNYLGECFMQIATRYSTKPSFSGYQFVEEMRSEGILTCIKYLRNYNPNKTQNPFAYFTQFVKNSFIQQINEEHKNLYLKYKNYQHMQSGEQLDNIAGEGPVDLNEISDAFIKKYEDKLEAKKKLMRETKARKKAEASAIIDSME